MLGSRTMGSSSGPRGSSIEDKIAKQIGFANEFLDTSPPPNLETVKDRIDGVMKILLNWYDPINVIVSNKSNLTTPEAKIEALTKLKKDGAKKFWLNLDITNSNFKYAPPVAYIQTLFNGFKPTNENIVVSYEPSSPAVPDIIAQQIDYEIAKLKKAPSVSKQSFFSRFGFGVRKQKRTKKGGKKSKRKTKRHKKTRSRRR